MEILTKELPSTRVSDTHTTSGVLGRKYIRWWKSSKFLCKDLILMWKKVIELGYETKSGLTVVKL